MTAYAELQVATNFSFLRGASHPEELMATAAILGLAAIAITDRNTLAGVVRAHVAAKQAGVRLVVGAHLDLEDAPNVLCFPTDRAAYGRLCQLITLGRRRAAKGGCSLTAGDLAAHAEGQIFAVVPPVDPDATFSDTLVVLKHMINARVYVCVSQHFMGDDEQRLQALVAHAAAAGVPPLATNDVHAHAAKRRPLQDVLTCIRDGCTLHAAGFRLFANAERHLKAPTEMARLFRDHPEAIANTIAVADACRFSLDELRYEYPVDAVAGGRTPQEDLARLTWIGAAERYPEGVPDHVERSLRHELALIEQLAFAPYFLTVHDIVRFARDRGILCQGRGSAANSAVCYCLGITAVDPARIELLFERFVSVERNEPPDIDVDFEHERREEVIQYVYRKHGREHSGMTATVIRYRTKSAVREVGKVLGLSNDAIVALQGALWRRHTDAITDAAIREVGLDPGDRTVRMTLRLAGTLIGFPRHLSQHTGGMVITKSPLSAVVPIENAAMIDRTVIEWDKDDLDALGILKIDLLGLGMLTCVRKAFDLIALHHGRRYTLATVPAEDPAVYDMLCAADSVGVFQVESRAQMAMLPRLKPRCFYDLVIEVAIVRPGPIQGDMVHPYLRRRNGEEPIVYPTEDLREVLGKTLGIPLFQEQAMKIAIVAAGFTPSQADGLRRAMATFRRSGAIHAYREAFVQGMVARGHDPTFADRCFRQIEGFANYGFPESHSASFALLVYVSSWLKCHYPAAFACALLNSQPMGFYAPAQIVGDARRHGVVVRPVDVNLSAVDNTLEPAADSVNGVALRLGFRQVKGLTMRDAEALTASRGNGYPGIADLWRRAGVGVPALTTLARADAFGSVGLDRQRALWAVRRLDETPLALFAAADAFDPPAEPDVTLPAISAGEQVANDYRTLRLSLKAHPVALLRGRLARRGVVPAERLARTSHGDRRYVAGIVVTRQRPGSANGVVFITLEDETGQANLIIWPKIFERFRQVVLTAAMIGVDGPVQRQGQVVHILAERLWDLTPLLGSLARDATPGRADEAKFDVQTRDFH